MIDTIVFDIGQVLVHFHWKEYIEDFHYSPEVTKKLMHATVEDNDHWSIQDRGAITDDEFILMCIEREPDIEPEIRLFFQQIDHIVTEYEYAPSLIRQLKENGYRVYLLSNYGRTTYQYAEKKFQFIKYVDGGIISSHVKVIKPEPEIYQLLVDTYDIKPENAVFLDDRLENIEAAQKLRFHTVHFQGLEQGRRELEALQVNLEGFLYN